MLMLHAIGQVLLLPLWILLSLYVVGGLGNPGGPKNSRKITDLLSQKGEAFSGVDQAHRMFELLKDRSQVIQHPQKKEFTAIINLTNYPYNLYQGKSAKVWRLP